VQRAQTTSIRVLVRSKPKDRHYVLQELLYARAQTLTPIRVLHAGGGSGLADAEWWSHFRPDALIVDAFEPDVNEVNKIAALARQHGYTIHCHPFALWSSTGERTLHVAAHGGASSLFSPNRRVASRLAYTPGSSLDNLHKVVEIRKVSVHSLDDLRKEGKIEPFDFMKLNVQGAELEILRGAGSLLPQVVGLQLEASFYQIYDGAPYFSDIDFFLRQYGFYLFDILAPNSVGRLSMPFVPRNDEGNRFWRWPSRQTIEAHILYLRDPIRDDLYASTMSSLPSSSAWRRSGDNSSTPSISLIGDQLANPCCSAWTSQHSRARLSQSTSKSGELARLRARTLFLRDVATKQMCAEQA